MKKKMISSWNNSVIIKKTLPKLGKLVIVKDIKSGVFFLGKKTRYEIFAHNLEDGHKSSTGFTQDRVWKYLPLIENNPYVWKPIDSLNTHNIIIFHFPKVKFPVNYILGYLDNNGMIRHGLDFKYRIPIKKADYFFEID